MAVTAEVVLAVYFAGVVLVRCDSCASLHLIADHLGWFVERETIEQILAARGEDVRRVLASDPEMLEMSDLAAGRAAPAAEPAEPDTSTAPLPPAK